MTWRLSRILFNTDMVRAILSGQKKVTRRVVKPQPFAVEQQKNAPCWCGHFVSENRNVIADKPPYRPGDILYVRETWCPHDTPNGRWYGDKADGDYRSSDYRWHPFHIPKEAARIFLRVTNVRVERLRDISLYDVWDEGTPQMPGNSDPDDAVGHEDFAYFWDSTVRPADRGLYGWAASPWVWVIEFERVSKEEASCA